MKKVVVLVPLYREEMSPEERASLCQCAKIFGEQREVVFFAPEKLNITSFLQLLPSARIERFNDFFFTSVSTYSHLLLTSEFYQRFRQYEYILIYQLDAWVFRDELDYWCQKDYDYIGAPFIQKYGTLEDIIVGNGGFSLRKTSAMLRVLDHTEQKMFPPALLWKFFRFYLAQKKYFQAVKPLLRMAGLYPNTRGSYLKQIRYEKHNSEDMVFYFLSKGFTEDGLSMPDIEEASLFSLDAAPERFFKTLPFGAHAWMKNDPEFWRQYIALDS